MQNINSKCCTSDVFEISSFDILPSTFDIYTRCSLSPWLLFSRGYVTIFLGTTFKRYKHIGIKENPEIMIQFYLQLFYSYILRKYKYRLAT